MYSKNYKTINGNRNNVNSHCDSDGTNLSLVQRYAVMNSSVLSLASKMLKLPAAMVFTELYQRVGV